ncbi:MAG: hypothetical protein IPQ04_05550 [Saprospiraceae bacterium]|jgi:Na+-transporting methylmalonyl-CoA/oxaloacetate decarboxylase gamma subunit|nr:hypothetical protein [Saprospiraceae bacterium]
MRFILLIILGLVAMRFVSTLFNAFNKPSTPSQTNPPSPKSKQKEGDYIEYEEIKD